MVANGSLASTKSMLRVVPKIQVPDDSSWSEDAETASSILSRPLRAQVMAYLNSDKGRKGVTRYEISNDTGVPMPTVTEALKIAEDKGLVRVETRRRNEGHGANLYFLDWNKYERAVHAFLDFAIGR